MYCVGCGDSINDALGRRNLDNPSNPDVKAVIRVWKNLMSSQNVDQEDLEAILSGADKSRPPKMCRKCFLAYKNHCSANYKLIEKLKQAVDCLNLSTNPQHEGPLSQASSVVESSTIGLELLQPIPPAKRVRLDNPSTSTNTSPDVTVSVQYQQAKVYKLTPSRRSIVKSVTRKSFSAVAIKALGNPPVRKHILHLLGKEISREVKNMSSDSVNSVLKSQDPEMMKTFNWDLLDEEMLTHAPVLRHFLQSSVATRLPQCNTQAVLGMCASIIFNHRNKMMNLVQKINSLILYSGHCSKKIYKRFLRLNLTVSHSSVLRLLDKVGKNFDAQVNEWAQGIQTTLDSSNEKHLKSAPWNSFPHAQFLDDFSESETESDTSVKSISPVTSEEEYCATDEDISSSEGSEADIERNEVDTIAEEFSELSTPESCIETPVSSNDIQQGHRRLFQICGDNIDKGIKPRYMRMDRDKPQDIHYFHHYAVLDRIDFSHLKDEVLPTLQTDINQVALSLLPTIDDDLELKRNICVLLSRILFKNLQFFQLCFDGTICWSIEHPYSKEMSTKSVVCPLGIIPEDENKTEGMLAIMKSVHKYVPMVNFTKEIMVPSLGKTVPLPSALVYPIHFSGDQKTVARARGVQKATANATTPLRRLEGLTPVVADWHTKLKLVEIIWKFFYSSESSSEHGTLYQLRNKLNRTNVVSTPKHDFNSCDDFLKVVSSGLICAAAIESFGMNTIEESPSDRVFPGISDVWTLPDSDRKEWLQKLCEHIYDSFVKLSFNTGECSLGSDGVKDYSIQLLRLCCFYLEFSDAIKEGDGLRVLRCWKYMIALFSGSGNTNYACEAANLLLQYHYTLSPRQSAQLIWSRFVNVHGLPRKNIPLDLHMEHLNRIAKEAVQNLGANKTKNTMERVGKAIGTLSPVLDQFDFINSVHGTSKLNQGPENRADVALVTNELLHAQCFRELSGRAHSKVPKPKDILKLKKRQELIQWLTSRMPCKL